jgi:outer membrane lipopolysaccharide assembly protein LptE/RlpB
MKSRPALGQIGVLLILVLLCTGCGWYSPKSGRTALVSSIGIPLMENQTPEYGLAEQLTSGVTDGLIAENVIDVVDPSRAASVLKATILTYSRSAYTFDAGENVQEYIVEITVRANLVSTDGETTIWDAPSIRAWGVYAADSETEQDGQTRAIKKLTEEILDRTVKGW